MLDGVPRPLGRPLPASMASATRRATMAGRSTPRRVSAAMRSRTCDASWMHGLCSVEACVSQLARHAWRRVEGRRMTRGAAERGAGGLCRTFGFVSDGRCDQLVLVCTRGPGAWRTALPDTLRPCVGMGKRVETPSLPRNMYSKLISNSYDRIPGPEHHHQTRHSYNEGREPQIRLSCFLGSPTYDVHHWCGKVLRWTWINI